MLRFVALLLILIAMPGRAGEAVRVAVAANFKPTLESINTLFEKQSPYRVVLSSASTGVLYSQILHGAPFDLFFAADEHSPKKLVTAGATDQQSSAFCYARGRLALAGSDTGLRQLADPQRSIAIGNPATAPYGKAAMEVLAREDFQEGSQRKLVRGNNVAQAYQFWHSGAVDLALLPRSLIPLHSTLVPADWHAPLWQFAVVLQRNQAVDAYLKWIRSDTVRALITEAGYEPCP